MNTIFIQPDIRHILKVFYLDYLDFDYTPPVGVLFMEKVLAKRESFFAILGVRSSNNYCPVCAWQ